MGAPATGNQHTCLIEIAKCSFGSGCQGCRTKDPINHKCDYSLFLEVMTTIRPLNESFLVFKAGEDLWSRLPGEQGSPTAWHDAYDDSYDDDHGAAAAGDRAPAGKRQWWWW